MTRTEETGPYYNLVYLYICPRSLVTFYIENNYIEIDKIFWTYSMARTEKTGPYANLVYLYICPKSHFTFYSESLYRNGQDFLDIQYGKG